MGRSAGRSGRLWKGAFSWSVWWCLTGCWPQSQPGLLLLAQEEAQCGQAGRRAHGCTQRLGTGACSSRRVLAGIPPPFPPLEPAPTLLRGRGMSTSTLLDRQETAALRAQAVAGTQATQLASRVPGCSLQVQALVSCPTDLHAHPSPAPEDSTRPGAVARAQQPKKDPKSSQSSGDIPQTECEINRCWSLRQVASEIERKLVGVLLQLPKLVTSSSCKYHQEITGKVEKLFSFVF